MNVSRGLNESKLVLQEKEAYSTAYIIVLVHLSVFICLLNIFVIFLFVRHDTLRSKTNKILVSLALADILNGMATVPLRISCNTETHPSLAQRLLTVIFYRVVAALTMFHILAVTLERHICIVHPLRYSALVTNTRIAIVLCAVWTFSVFYGTIGLSWLGLHDEFSHLEGPPTLRNSKIMRFELAYIAFGFLFCFFIPLLIMFYSFWKIFKEICRHTRHDSILGMHPEKRRRQIDKKPLLLFMAMVSLFVINWSSWYVQLFILAAAPHHYHIYGGYLTECLRFSASFIHPLLYSLVKKDFRAVVSVLLKQIRNRITGRGDPSEDDAISLNNMKK